MGDVVEVRTTWAQALAWRLERQLLSPISSASAGSTSVGDVVRRLVAVLAMDESLADLAVGARRASSHCGVRVASGS